MKYAIMVLALVCVLAGPTTAIAVISGNQMLRLCTVSPVLQGPATVEDEEATSGQLGDVFIKYLQVKLLAHMQAKGVVKERMDLMKKFASAMKKINLALGKFTSKEMALIVYESKIIADNSGKLMHLFPPGSGGPVSEASPKIWASPGDFKKKISAFMRMAKELEENINSRDLNKLIRNFRALAATCKNCHRDYRVKKAL